jgi:hypothetical protein
MPETHVAPHEPAIFEPCRQIAQLQMPVGCGGKSRQYLDRQIIGQAILGGCVLGIAVIDDGQAVQHALRIERTRRELILYIGFQHEYALTGCGGRWREQRAGPSLGSDDGGIHGAFIRRRSRRQRQQNPAQSAASNARDGHDPLENLCKPVHMRQIGMLDVQWLGQTMARMAAARI